MALREYKRIDFFRTIKNKTAKNNGNIKRYSKTNSKRIRTRKSFVSVCCRIMFHVEPFCKWVDNPQPTFNINKKGHFQNQKICPKK